MRINFILPPDGIVGGLRVISIYAKSLAQRGHDVRVIHPLHPPIRFREVIRSLRHHHKFPKSANKGPSYFTEIQAPLNGGSFQSIKLPHTAPVTAADVPDGDIVIATWWETAEWVWALPPSKGQKVHFVQGYEIWTDNPGGVERVNDVYRLPTAKIIIAQWMGELLRTRFNQSPVAIVPNSVDSSLFFAPPRGKQPVPTVGFIYSTIPLKCSHIAIEAIKRARTVLPELRVITFGSEEPLPSMRLPPGATFMRKPPQQTLREMYASCDAWLFASRDEGFGLPILEAMACRTPVIGSPSGAAPELISRGGGRIVLQGDAQSMADAIINVAGMPDAHWRAMSDIAHATATGYTWDDATERFEAALEQVRAGDPALQLEQAG